MSLGLGTACIPDFPAESPYDPETPEAQQAKAQVMGQVVAETAIELTEIQLVIEGQGVAANADAMGQFKVELAAGEYVLRIRSPQHDDLNLGTLVLNTGEKRDLGRLSLVAKRGAIEGSVKLGGSTDNSGALVSVSKIQRSVFTDASGNFAISDVAIGDYELLIMREGYATQIIKDIKVEEGQSATVSVSLAQLASDADFSINDNALYTAQREVTLNLAGFAFNSVQVSETANFAEMAAPLPRMDAQSYSLSEGDGPKRIFVRFTNSSAAPYEFSKVYSASIILDTTAPSLSPIAAAEYTRALVVPVSLIASDAGSGLAQMQINGGAWEAFRARIDVTVSTGDGPKSISVKVRDNLGNESSARSTTVTLDTQAPVVSGDIFTINGADTHTNLANVQLQFDVSGADFVQISETQAFTETTTVAYRSSGNFPWYLSGADGSKTLYVRFLDQARNVTMPYSASITLDTVAPNASRMVLYGGVVATNAANVSLGLTPDPSIAGHHLQLQGDITAPGSFLSNAIPAQVTLTAGEGPKVVTAVLYDDAGNTSVPFSAFIELDTTPPDTGNVILADGRSTVNAREISVTINDTNPDTISFWERSGASCVNPVCGTPQFQAFSPSTSFTLSENRGTKTVCWKFCDEAGNGTTPGSASLDLGTYLPRPRPVLDSISPASHVALIANQAYQIIVQGDGIASDTRVHVGPFTYDCDTLGAGLECVPGTSGGTSNCANACTVTLDDNVMANSGNYVVRLDTPDPVLNGQNLSADVAFFAVVAPVPELVSVQPKGIIQEVDVSGFPIQQTVTATIRISKAMDNVTFRLGPNYGRILRKTPACGAGVSPCYTQDMVVELDTSGLMPLDPDDQEIIAINPAPGGGSSHSIRFGVNRRVTDCTAFPCVSNLRGTRVPTGTRMMANDLYFYSPPIGTYQPVVRSRAQTYRVPGASGEYAWLGGSSASLGQGEAQINQGGADDYSPMLRTRVNYTSSNGRVPFSFPPVSDATLRLEHKTGGQTQVIIHTNTSSTPNGRFMPAELVPNFTAPSGISELFVADMNGDGRPDVLTNEGSFLSDTLTNAYTATNWQVTDLVDLNGDGKPDVISGGNVYPGNGNGTLGLPIGLPTGGQFVDVNADGLPDLIFSAVNSNNGFFNIQKNQGGFRFGAVQSVLPQTTSGCNPNEDELDCASRLGVLQDYQSGSVDLQYIVRDVVGIVPDDLNLDGHVDFVLSYLELIETKTYNQSSSYSDSQKLDVVYGTGGGEFGVNTSIALGINTQCGVDFIEDLNSDGLGDLIGSCDGSLAIFLADGQGGFGLPNSFPLPNPSWSFDEMLLRDVDLDGKLDIVVGQIWDAYVYRGRGDGLFHSPVNLLGNLPCRAFNDCVYGVTSFIIEDLNLDGLDDIIVGNLVHYGEGRFSGGVVRQFDRINQTGENDYGENGILVDVNLDGKYDLLTSSQGGWLGTALGDGKGGFADIDISMYPPNLLATTKAVDINGDGRVDIVTDHPTQSSVSITIWTQNALGGFDQQSWGVPPANSNCQGGSGFCGDDGRLIDVRDVNGDGYPDIISAHQDKFYVYAGDNSGSYSTRTTEITLPSNILNLNLNGPFSIEFSTFATCNDRNNDGFLDVLIETDSGTVELIGNGQGAFTSRLLSLAESQGAIEADCDNSSQYTGFHRERFTDLNGDGQRTEFGTPEDFCTCAGNGYISSATQLTASCSLDIMEQFMEGSIMSYVDLNADQQLDISDGEKSWILPSPRSFDHELTNLPPMTLPIVAGQTVTFPAYQKEHYIEKLAIRVRLEGTGLDQVSLTLRDPNGSGNIVLDNGSTHAGATEWIASYTAGLETFHGWQDAGAWQLSVTNAGTQAVQLIDYAVITHGGFYRPMVGSGTATPNRLDITPTTSGLILEGTTTSKADKANLSCANTQAPAVPVVANLEPLLSSADCPTSLPTLCSPCTNHQQSCTYRAGQISQQMECMPLMTGPGLGYLPIGGDGRCDPNRPDNQIAVANITQRDPWGPGEYWYEFTLSQSETANLSAIADFNAGIEIRTGPCATAQSVVACDHNVGSTNVLSLANLNLNAGTYCLVVDGVYDPVTDARHNGKFEISLQIERNTVCGNGQIEVGETCDDGNDSSADGCSSSCSIEPGYQCTGTPSTCTTACGNSQIDAGEGCDDGNSTAGDGCDSSCAIEPGYQCTGTPSTCTASSVTTYAISSSSQVLVPSTSGANVWGVGPIPDDGSTSIAMGFDFMFLADTVQNVTIGSNGLLGFNAGDDYDAYENLLTGINDDTNGFIAWWWDDLSPATSATSGIRTELNGTAPNRIRTITFENLQQFNTARTITAEVRFYESTNVIEVHYGTVGGSSGSFSATAGWENSDGTAGANFIPGCTNDCDENDWLTNTLITLTPQ